MIYSIIKEHLTFKRFLLASCTWTFIGAMFTPVFLGTVDKTFGGQMQFLTVIALFLTSVTLALNSFTNMKTLTYDMLVTTTVLETIVTIYYWGMFHYDRGLLYPPHIQNIPFLVDICLHFFPALALWMELLTTVKLHKVSSKHIYIIAFFSIGYMLWAEYCYVQNGYYVYPVLKMLDKKGKVLLTLATIIVGAIISVLSVQVHSLYGTVSLGLDKLRGKRHFKRIKRINDPKRVRSKSSTI